MIYIMIYIYIFIDFWDPHWCFCGDEIICEWSTTVIIDYGTKKFWRMNFHQSDAPSKVLFKMACWTSVVLVERQHQGSEPTKKPWDAPDFWYFSLVISLYVPVSILLVTSNFLFIKFELFRWSNPHFNMSK